MKTEEMAVKLKYRAHFTVSGFVIHGLLFFVASAAVAQHNDASPVPSAGHAELLGGNGYHPPLCAPRDSAPDCISAPRVVSSPPPRIPRRPEGRKLREGDCILILVVDENGNPTNIRVIRNLGMGLDERLSKS
jgi:hypothetical protein